MSLAQKMQQGGTAPTLYSFYGKQYDYNDLAKAADAGLNDYLAGLKRGDKDSADFRNAYANLMSGIKDGTVTFDNGRFHDSQGRYTNSDKKNRDYYGLIANYIYGKMGQSNPYQKPEDPSKISWDSNSVKTALMRQLYNSDSGNMQDFLDLDKEKDGVRGITNRSAYLAKALQAVADNWDTTFQGYQDADKSRYVPLLVNAAKALQDGTIDPGDYLALSKAVGGIDFREMMATGTPTTIPTTPVTTQTPEAVAPAQQPPVKMKHAILTDQSYDSKSLGTLTSMMSRVPTKGLINILRNSFYNKRYNFGSDPRVQHLFGTDKISSKAGVSATLNALYAQGVLQQADSSNPNLYYIPGLRTKYGTGWVWDKANNVITEMSVDKIPYVKTRLAQQVQQAQQQAQVQTDQSGMFTAYTPVHKSGGILKADSGIKVPFYSGLQEYNPGEADTTWGSTSYGLNDKGERVTSYGNSGQGYTTASYGTDPNFQDYTDKGKGYASSVENQQEYKDFTDTLVRDAKSYMDATDKSTFNAQNNAFINWSQAYDKSLPTDSTATFFDKDGKLRTSWGLTNKDSYGRGPNKPITDVYERIKAIRNDQLLSNGHNNLMREGTRYFYKDANGVQHWVDPKVAKSGKYKISTNGTKNTEGITNWTDYEVTGLNSDTQIDSQGSGKTGTGSNIDRTQQNNKLNWFQRNGQKLAEDVAPLAIGAGRLLDSMNTNNRIADVIRGSIKPDLLNTYERYSPVTGAFSEMQLRNRQAADLRRQAAQPYTSDSSLNAARSLEANKQATDIEYQGFLADDKEVQRTKAAALDRQEDNMARRTDVANKNIASVNAANQARAQTEANRLKSNWQSRDNFLSGIEQDLVNKKAQREADQRQELYNNRQTVLNLDLQDVQRPDALKAKALEQTYNDDLQDLKTKFNSKLVAFAASKGKEPDEVDYTNEQFYKDYITNARALRDKYTTDSNQLAEDSSKNMRNYFNNLRANMGRSPLFKNGGTLNQSIYSLLHKVMNQ